MYQIENPIGKAMSGMGNAANTFGRMGQDIPANRKPGPSAGGAIMSGAGGAVMGSQVGSMMGAAAATKTAAMVPALGMGPVGWAIGGLALGIGSYLLS